MAPLLVSAKSLDDLALPSHLGALAMKLLKLLAELHIVHLLVADLKLDVPPLGKCDCLHPFALL